MNKYIHCKGRIRSYGCMNVVINVCTEVRKPRCVAKFFLCVNFRNLSRFRPSVDIFSLANAAFVTSASLSASQKGHDGVSGMNDAEYLFISINVRLLFNGS